MTMIRSLAIGLAAAVFVWTAAPALAGPGGGFSGGQGSRPMGGFPGGHGFGGSPTGGHAMDRDPGSNASNEKGDNPHSNKSGECRGLTRAEQVASTQGKNTGLQTAAEHASEEAQEACK